MPNCDWYGTIEDHQVVLEYVFSQSELSVWELASTKGPLRSFSEVGEILKEFERPYPVGGKQKSSVYLQPYVEGSCARGFVPHKEHGREFADGFGLVQLYLERPSGEPSHTNHSSKKCAEKWNSLVDHDNETDWDFDLVARTSSRLNRFIRKSSEEKIGFRVLLPGAADLWHAGKADFFI